MFPQQIVTDGGYLSGSLAGGSAKPCLHVTESIRIKEPDTIWWDLGVPYA